MASFLKDLGKIISEKAEVVAKKTGEVADVVVKKTEQTVEVQKIKSQISVMQRNNDRDYRDMNRKIAPLKQADDAILVDSSEMSIDEVVDTIVSIVNDKM